MADRSSSSRWTRRGFLAAGAAIVGAGATAGARGLTHIDGATVSRQAERLVVPTRKRWRTRPIGTSVQGRPIEIHSNTTWPARFTLMVVAAVHGDERGAGAIGRHLATVDIPDGINCHAIPIANPDGWAAGTRNNANDVDLNRNFPWGWRPFDGGRGPLTEPESRALAAAVTFIRPSLIVWIHQPYSYVAPINPAAAEFARTWAQASELPVRYGVRQGGGAETWCGLELGIPSILVEAITREDRADQVAAHRRGFDALLASV